MPTSAASTTEAAEIHRLRQSAIHSSRRRKNSAKQREGPRLRPAERLEQRHQQRIAHQPGEQGHDGEGWEEGAARFTALTSLLRRGERRGSGLAGRSAAPAPPAPGGFGATRTVSPTAAAPDGGEHLELASRRQGHLVVGHRAGVAPLDHPAGERPRIAAGDEGQRLGADDEVHLLARAERLRLGERSADQRTGPADVRRAPGAAPRRRRPPRARRGARSPGPRRWRRSGWPAARRAPPGVPTWCSTPPCSTATRSPRWKASSCSWVTRTVVMPTRWIAARSSRRVRSRSVGIEVRERLVEQQHARLGREGAGERHPLLLAARDLAHPPRLEAGEVDQGERLGHPAGGAASVLPFGRRGRRRRSRPPSDAGRGRSAGRPCRSGGAREAGR